MIGDFAANGVGDTHLIEENPGQAGVASQHGCGFRLAVVPWSLTMLWDAATSQDSNPVSLGTDLQSLRNRCASTLAVPQSQHLSGCLSAKHAFRSLWRALGRQESAKATSGFRCTCEFFHMESMGLIVHGIFVPCFERLGRLYFSGRSRCTGEGWRGLCKVARDSEALPCGTWHGKPSLLCYAQ